MKFHCCFAFRTPDCFDPNLHRLKFDLARLQDSVRLDVGTFTSFDDLRDKSPQVNHINLACFKLNGDLDSFESVFFTGLVHSTHGKPFKIETRMQMQTKTSSKQHFII